MTTAIKERKLAKSMSATFELSKLKAAVSAVSAACSTKNVKPILQCVMIRAQGGTVILSATNLEVFAELECEALSVEGDWEALLPGKRIAQILSNASGSEVEISQSENGIRIKTARSKFNLPTEPTQEFPRIPESCEKEVASIPCALLSAMLRKVSFAADEISSASYQFDGVRLEKWESGLAAVTTDQNHAAVYRVDREMANMGVTIPALSVRHMLRLFPGSGDCSISVSDNAVVFRWQRGRFYARLLEGRYPKFEPMVNGSWKPQHFVPILAGDFSEIVLQACTVSADESKHVELLFSDGTIASQKEAELGSCNAELPINYSGPEILIRLDAFRLREVCRVLDSAETVQIGLIDEVSAFSIQSDCGFTYYLMPMKKEA